MHTYLRPTGGVHFSDLKKMSLSPAHYLASVGEEFQATKAMRIGTIVHRSILGGEGLAVWEADRRGNAWKAFKAANEDSGVEIVTRKELDEAAPIAASLARHPLAQRYLKGRHEVPLEWKSCGFPCRTRGVDVVGDGWLADLKVTNSTQPGRWAKQALGMLYHAQLAYYDEGARSNGIDTSKGLFLIGVEAKAPYPVTVLKLTPRALEAGRKCIGLWLGQLAVAVESNAWLEYSASVLDLDIDDEGVELTIGGQKFDWDEEENAA